jgi:hypothetical protein
MNWKSTLVLLIVVAGLGAFVFWGESGTETSNPGNKPSPRPIQNFKVDDVTKVVIERGKDLKEQIVLAKDGNNWRMEKPLTDKADDTNVRGLLAPIEFLDAVSVRVGDEYKKVDFGTVEQRLTVSRPAEKGGDFTFEVGAASVTGERNLRQVGKDILYVVKKDLPEKIGQDLFLFRSKELFTIAPNDAAKLTAKLPGAGEGPNVPTRLLELVKVKGSWRLGGSDGELAETHLVSQALSKANGLRSMGVASDAPSDADLASYGLSPAEDEVSVADASKTETLSIGKKVDAAKNDERYVRLAGKPTVYRVDATELLKELLKDPTTFRSDSLVPLAASTEGVTAFAASWKGGSWSLKKTDQAWGFETPTKASADLEAVRSLLKAATELKISTREEGTKDKVGLADPAVTITISEGDVQHVLQVGNSAEGGMYWVCRGGEARIFTAKLGDLPTRLQGAVLALRTKSLFKASFWDLQCWKLTDAEGKVESSGEKQGNDWILEGVKKEDVDTAKISKAFETFSDLKADALVAEVTSESVPKYGLDKPRTLALTTESWEAGNEKKKKEEKVLLIGNREGDSVNVMEKGGAVIGKVKAEFLDLIHRGFRKGKEIFTYASYDCVSFVVKEGANEILHLEKKKEAGGVQDEWFLGDRKLVTADVTEKLLKHFDKLEGFQNEDAKTKAHGLDNPWRTIEVKTKANWGEHKDEVTTKTLLLGQHQDEHDVWAMDAAGTELGLVYDGPILKLDAFIKDPPFAAAPSPKEEKKDGTAAVGTPSK